MNALQLTSLRTFQLEQSSCNLLQSLNMELRSVAELEPTPVPKSMVSSDSLIANMEGESVISPKAVFDKSISLATTVK